MTVLLLLIGRRNCLTVRIRGTCRSALARRLRLLLRLETLLLALSLPGELLSLAFIIT
jgi:hypothetical protein